MNRPRPFIAVLATIGLGVVVAFLDASTGGWGTVNWALIVVMVAAVLAAVTLSFRRR